MKPTFDATFFTQNRQNFIQSLGHGSLVVMTAYGQMQRNNDMAFKFEQESNFWYLTGIESPEWWVIIDGSQGRTWLVRPESDPVKAIFEGALGDKEALRQSGADTVIDRTEARRLLGSLRPRHRIAYTVRPQSVRARHGFHPNPALKELGDVLGQFEMRDCRKELAVLRSIKRPVEIGAIQTAIDITIRGFERVLEELPKLKAEYEVEAIFNYEFRATGGNGHAYDPIVAAGQNACTLHYVDNDQPLGTRSWLLMDVGAKISHYCADITRTLPVTKQWTKRQQAIYEAAERVHDAAVALCKPGMSVAEYQQSVDDAMTAELLDLQLMRDEGDDEALRRYFPHAISHGLGVDVHDSLGSPKVFKAGMVLTVEPGIYVPEEAIGVRIENDILITDKGPRNLSAALPSNLDALVKLSYR